MPPTWPILMPFAIVIIIFCLVIFRLGVKSEYLRESDIITHYSNIYLEHERMEGRNALPSDCYASALSGFFERLQIICEPLSAAPYRYIVGYWGQLVRLKRDLGLSNGLGV